MTEDKTAAASSGVSEISPAEWQRRCAARYMERGAVGERAAIEMAREAWALAQEDAAPGDGLMNPEEAADDDMDCWEDDGDE